MANIAPIPRPASTSSRCATSTSPCCRSLAWKWTSSASAPARLRTLRDMNRAEKTTRRAKVALFLTWSLVVGHWSFAAENGVTAPAAFLQTYCIDCHGPNKQKGERRFDQLTLPATKAEDL